MAYLAGGTYYILGSNLRAVDETQRAAELDPHMVLNGYVSAAALSQAGRHDEAIDTARRAVTLTGRSPFMVAVLATVLDAAGRGAESRALLDELSDRRGREFVSDGILAVALAAAGERDAALTALERAVANHGGSFPWMLFVHAFDSVRRDPRFRKVLERIGYTGSIGRPARTRGLSRRRLRRLQHELDLHRLERELDPAVSGAAENARLQQGRHVPVDGLHIAPYSPRGLSDGNRTLSA